jgi:hypothetical protein
MRKQRSVSVLQQKIRSFDEPSHSILSARCASNEIKVKHCMTQTHQHQQQQQQQQQHNDFTITNRRQTRTNDDTCLLNRFGSINARIAFGTRNSPLSHSAGHCSTIDD